MQDDAIWFGTKTHRLEKLSTAEGSQSGGDCSQARHKPIHCFEKGAKASSTTQRRNLCLMQLCRNKSYPEQDQRSPCRTEIVRRSLEQVGCTRGCAFEDNRSI